jgi:hypothetical protein
MLEECVKLWLFPPSCWFLAWRTLPLWASRGCFSETSADFHRTTRRHIPEDRTLHNIICLAVQCDYICLSRTAETPRRKSPMFLLPSRAAAKKWKMKLFNLRENAGYASHRCYCYYASILGTTINGSLTHIEVSFRKWSELEMWNLEFETSSLLCKASDWFLKTIFKPKTDFVIFIVSELSAFWFGLFLSNNNRVCLTLFTILWTVFFCFELQDSEFYSRIF